MNIAKKNEPEPLIHFAGFTLDLVRRGLYRGPQRVHLTSKPLETLIYLVENRGRIIEKQDLLDAVWKDTFVTEDNLVHAIREIRRALGDDKENPRFVQTVPRQGYRFVCEVSAGDLAQRSIPVNRELRELHAGAKRRTLQWLWIAVPVLAFIPILIWFWWPRGGTSETKLTPGAPRAGRINKQITVGEFSSSKPMLSPDGKFILYVSSSKDTRGYGDLFVKQFPEGTPVRITNNINPSGDLPVFSGDGRHVVFSIPRIGHDEARHHDLWRVPSFGGPPERFIEDANGAGFSPDGKWVAYTKCLPSGNAMWVSSVTNRDAHLELSAVGYTPRWSSNGEWLAYTTSDPNRGVGDICVCRISQSSGGLPAISERKQITTEREQMYGLTWSADSRSIIFASKRAGSMHLYQVSIADGSIMPLLGGVGEYVAPSASPDGNNLVFQQYRLTNDLLVSTLGANCKSKNVTYGEFHRWPRISPSGEKLATVLRQVDDTERLYLINLKTKESSQLSDRAASYPCWLDEENIAYLSPVANSQSTEVLATNIVTRETRSLTVFSSDSTDLAIHPDKRRVTVCLKTPDGRQRILLRDLSSGVDETIHQGSEYEYLRWSPDGSALCWDKPGASRNAPHVSGGIWMAEIGQSEPRLIARDGYCPVWSEDGAAIYFTIREGRQGLWRYDLRQKREHLICSCESVFSYDIAGTRLVFAQLKNDSQIYAMSLNQ